MSFRPAAQPAAIRIAEDDALSALQRVAPAAGRVNWANRAIVRSLAPGESAHVTAEFAVTQLIAAPRFRVNSNGTVLIDPATIPARLEPGRRYAIGLTVRMPEGSGSQRLATIELSPDGGRSIDERLIIRLVPR
ncbi:MAG: hypothetical protein EPO26_01560 [Chloroflexota bacterium]|nr:MAG: hypothetical protein EPO26_01560 [Chloroflexota bacterium]